MKEVKTEMEMRGIKVRMMAKMMEIKGIKMEMI